MILIYWKKHVEINIKRKKAALVPLSYTNCLTLTKLTVFWAYIKSNQGNQDSSGNVIQGPRPDMENRPTQQRI